MSTRSIEQRRAQHALQAVRRILDENSPDLAARYRAYVDRLGPSILANGLGQAVATERAAAGADPKEPDKRAHGQLAKNLESWLCGDAGIYRSGDLLDAITRGDQKTYLRAQAEALSWLVWHKKFCRAYLREGSSRAED